MERFRDHKFKNTLQLMISLIIAIYPVASVLRHALMLPTFKIIPNTLFHLNTLRPRQNGRHFPDDIFNCIFLNENAWIWIKISLKFVPKGPINKIPALVQIMAWRRPGVKPLSEPMMVSLPTHICVTRPQCVKDQGGLSYFQEVNPSLA